MIPTLGGGGAERQLALLSVEQAKQGHDVHVALLSEGPNAVYLTGSGVTVHHVVSRGNHDPMILMRLTKVIRRCRPDVVQTWLTQMDILGGAAARLCGVPWVMTERSSALCYPPTAKNWARVRAARAARGVITNSRAGAAYWAEQAPALPTIIVPNAVSVDASEVSPRSQPTEHSCTTPRSVLTAGRFSAEKNLAVLVQAFARIPASENVRLLVCGDGPERMSIERVVSENGVADRAALLGYRTDLPRLMHEASVFVSVSLYEGHPNTVLEAMACGCPLVVSDIPTHREFLDESCAWLVDPTSPEDIANAVARALEDTSEAHRRAERARERVLDFSIERMAAGYDSVYDSVLGARAADARVAGSE
jgi:glycosyltransferase involved in cell wall biosynthesis